MLPLHSCFNTTGDGLVDFDDLTPWSVSYWSGVAPTGMANYKVKYDVGPTSTNNVYGIPAVDGKIQFEDFVIFAMSYGLSASNVYPKIECRTNRASRTSARRTNSRRQSNQNSIICKRRSSECKSNELNVCRTIWKACWC